MTARLIFVAAATLTLAGTAIAADPAKPDSQEAASPVQPHRELLMAAADTKSPAPLADAQAQAPAKRRVARVTTCRCGDPQPTESQGE
jgi:hypothetical protein